ncbi:MAG: alpha/beta hydrolase-fold protein [Litorimonas sp.]
MTDRRADTLPKTGPRRSALPGRRRCRAALAVLAAFALMACATPPSAPEVRGPAVAWPDTHSRTVDAVGGVARYRLNVMLPPDYASDPQRRYPVLVVLNGDRQFRNVVQASQGVQLSGQVEPVIVVGVAYPEADYADAEAQGLSPLAYWYQRRALEFTPTRDDALDAAESEQYRIAVRSGGAERLRRALREDILPTVARDYRMDGTLALYGFSYGGLFAADEMLRPDRMFSRYGLGDPTLNWDGDYIARQVQARGEAGGDLPVRVFLSAGDANHPDVGESRDFHERVLAFGRQLEGSGFSGLELTTHVFAGENHMSVSPATASRMLRALFPAEPDMTGLSLGGDDEP